MVSLVASVTDGAPGTVSIGAVSIQAESDKRDKTTRRPEVNSQALFGLNKWLDFIVNTATSIWTNVLKYPSHIVGGTAE
jgi:hypothetical protein